MLKRMLAFADICFGHHQQPTTLFLNHHHHHPQCPPPPLHIRPHQWPPQPAHNLGESPTHHSPHLLNTKPDSSAASNLEDEHSVPNASCPHLTAMSPSLSTNSSNPDDDHAGPKPHRYVTDDDHPDPTAHCHASWQAQAAPMMTTTWIPMPSHINCPLPIITTSTTIWVPSMHRPGEPPLFPSLSPSEHQPGQDTSHTLMQPSNPSNDHPINHHHT